MEQANKALLELLNGEWEDLYQTSESLLESDKDNPIPKFLLMVSCYFVNPPKLAKSVQLTEELERSPNDVAKILNWIKQFENQKEYNNPYLQGSISLLIGFNNVEEEVVSLEKALTEFPNCPELYFWSGLSWAGTEKAFEYYKKALELRPNFPSALLYLAITCIHLKRFEEAEECFKKAIDFSPNFVEAHYQLGCFYYHHKGLKDQSTEHFQKVAGLDRESEVGRDAKKYLEGKSQPQFGVSTSKKGILTMPKGLIIGLSILSIFIVGGPISGGNPTVGIAVGVIVFIILSALFGRRS